LRPVAAFLLASIMILVILFYVLALDIGLQGLSEARDAIYEAAQDVGVNVTLHDYAGHARRVVATMLWILPVGCLATALVVMLHTRNR